MLAAITPDELRIYQQIDPAGRVRLLPLRTLPALLRPAHPARDAAPLKVFFMGASYQIRHNRAALAFILGEIVPLIRQRAPGAFEFHLRGSKAPADLAAQAAVDVIFDGYVPDLDVFLAGMDLALIPSLLGVGMQQKVFESLCRGFPTLTHPRALAGYPFVHGAHLLTAGSAAEFAARLVELRDPVLRQNLASGAAAQAGALFGPDVMRQAVQAVLDAALDAPPRRLRP